MAKPRKNETGSKWLGRKNKSRQDAMPVQHRERAADHADRLRFMQEKRPVRAADWGNVSGGRKLTAENLKRSIEQMERGELTDITPSLS